MTPSEFREHLDIHKSRMNGLSCGEESMTIYSAVLIGCQRVTDRQTDVQPISITCFSIADARKKGDEHSAYAPVEYGNFTSLLQMLFKTLGQMGNGLLV